MTNAHWTHKKVEVFQADKPFGGEVGAFVTAGPRGNIICTYGVNPTKAAYLLEQAAEALRAREPTAHEDDRATSPGKSDDSVQE